MLALGMAFIFAGYTVGGYGWVLIKGWNIPFRQWVSPLNPYQWPAGGPPPAIDQTKLFPSSPATGTAASSGGASPPPAML